jgi:hypothetical protein
MIPKSLSPDLSNLFQSASHVFNCFAKAFLTQFFAGLRCITHHPGL